MSMRSLFSNVHLLLFSKSAYAADGRWLHTESSPPRGYVLASGTPAV